jgi:hypothetical protein
MDFADLTERFCKAACTSGAELAALFTDDGVYHDGFYGAFEGRAAIAGMIDNHFRRDAEDFVWRMIDPVRQGELGYARYLFGYTSKMAGSEDRRVVFEGIGRFRLDGDHIAEYREAFDQGLAMVQLGFTPERIVKRLARNAAALRADPGSAAFL